MSDVLSAEEVTDLRDEVSALFPDRAAIHRRTEAQSEFGGEASTYSPAEGLESVPVLFGVRRGAEIFRMSVEDAQIDQLFTFPGGLDIRQTDRIVVEAPHAGTYEVLSVGGGGSWEITIPVAARRLP